MRVLMILGHDLLLPYPDNRVLKEARSISSAGHDLTVLCWLKRLENLPEFMEYENFKIRRITQSFPDRNVWIGLKWPSYRRLRERIISLATQLSPDIIHCHDLETLPIGSAVKKRIGSKLVYDSHEDWSLMEAANSKAWGLITRQIELSQLQHIDLVVASTEHIRNKLYSKKYRSLIVMNCPSISQLQDLAASDTGSKKEKGLDLAYFGSLLNGRFILEAIDAISKQNSWNMLIGGDGALNKIVRSASDGLDRIKFLGPLLHKDVMKWLAQCEASLVMFDPSNKNNIFGAPNRLFESMSIGIPTILTRDTYAAEIALSEGCGYVCDYNEQTFSQLLSDLAKSPQEMIRRGKRGRAAFMRKYNWESQVSAMIDAYSELATGK